MQRTAIAITALLSLSNGQIMEQPTGLPTYIPIGDNNANATDPVIMQQGGAIPVNINVDPNFYQPPGYNYRPTTNLPYPEQPQCYTPPLTCAPCPTGPIPTGGYQYPTGGYQYPTGGYQYPTGGYQYPNACNNQCPQPQPQYQNICQSPCQYQTSVCGGQNSGYQYPSGFFGVNGNQYQNTGFVGPNGGFNGQCGRPYCPPSVVHCNPYNYGPGPYQY